MYLVYLYFKSLMLMKIKYISTILTTLSLIFTSFTAKGNDPKVNGLDYIKVTPKFDGNRIGKVNLEDSLLAHYSFDGNALDSSGNSNHGSSDGPKSNSATGSATRKRFCF